MRKCCSCTLRAPILGRDQRKPFPGLFQQAPSDAAMLASDWFDERSYLFLGRSDGRIRSRTTDRVRNAADPIFSAVVPGSLASVFIESRFTPPGPVVLKPSTTAVTFNGRPASVLGSDGQGGVLVLVPSDTPLGNVDVKVAYQFQGFNLTAAANFNCVHSLFGVFTLGFGYGPALARQGSEEQVNNLLHPVHPGDIVALWGTGMGDATPDQVRVLLGGHAAPVLYAGPAPGFPGVDQVNFQVPDDPAIPDGCSVALEVDVAAEYRSNLSRLSKSSAPGCQASIEMPLGSPR